jgi:hypothetical protein
MRVSAILTYSLIHLHVLLSFLLNVAIYLFFSACGILPSLTLPTANGIPIEGWTHDPNDEALLDLLPVLDSLRFTSDVRRVLGIRGFL